MSFQFPDILSMLEANQVQEAIALLKGLQTEGKND